MLPAELNGSLAREIGQTQSARLPLTVRKADQRDGGKPHIVCPLVDFDGAVVKSSSAARFTTKKISMSQRIESLALISAAPQARYVLNAIGEKALQEFCALTAGAQAIESRTFQVNAEKDECVLIALEADEGLVKLNDRSEVFEAFDL